MPAAAVIPAPIAYIKVVAVKKLVVEYLAGAVLGSRAGSVPGHPYGKLARPSLVG